MRHSPTSPGLTVVEPGRVTLRVMAGGRVGRGQADVRSGSALPLRVASHSLPTVQAEPPTLRIRTTRVRAPDVRAVAGGARSLTARRDTAGSTRTTVSAVVAPSSQCLASHAGSNASLLTPTGRPAPYRVRSNVAVPP